MGELDKFFGPSSDENRDFSREGLRSKTDFPHVEEALRPILDGYLQAVRRLTVTPDFFPHKQAASAWKATARKLREALQSHRIPSNEWFDFMGWACDIMKERGLSNHVPGSVEFLVSEWKMRAGGCAEIEEYAESWNFK
jgi:hypothetical protein